MQKHLFLNQTYACYGIKVMEQKPLKKRERAKIHKSSTCFTELILSGFEHELKNIRHNLSMSLSGFASFFPLAIAGESLIFKSENMAGKYKKPLAVSHDKFMKTACPSQANINLSTMLDGLAPASFYCGFKEVFKASGEFFPAFA